MPRLYLLFGFSALVLSLKAQQTPLLKVYLDSNTHPITGWSYLHTEVTFVNYVSDRRLCDVQVQLTYEPVGNGAVRYRFFFFGYGAFEGQNDTITWHAEANENDGSIREKTVQRIKQGLLPYLLQTPLAEAIDYNMSPTKANNQQTEDRWDLRTYQPRLDYYGSANRYRNNKETKRTDYVHRLSLGFDTWKVTPSVRTNTGILYQQYQNLHHIDTQSYKSVVKSLALNMGYTRAIAKKWSLGGSIYASFNDNSNTKAGTLVSLNPSIGIEYSLFPYKDFFRQRLTFTSYISLYQNEYTTSFYQHPSFPIWQSWSINYAKVGRWGYVACSLGAGAKYAKTDNNFRLNLDPSLAINVGKNIFVTFLTHANLDQSIYKRNIVNAAGMVEQIRDKRNALSYQTSIGLAYYFGSGYRNIVNPRMWGNSIPI